MTVALIMVGLPARGKTYTARRIARHLDWLGHRSKVFNVGNYRRQQSGADVPHQFSHRKMKRVCERADRLLSLPSQI